MTKIATYGAAVILGVAAFAVPASADKGGVPHNGGGQGSDQAAQPATPAQPAQPTVAPATPATPATPAQPAADHGHPAREHQPAKQSAPKHGAPESQGAPAGHRGHKHAAQPESPTPAPSPHANAGKTTICHATGSQTNPYVEITISNHALPAHRRHQDGRDIIPAPAGGCPGTTTPAAPSGQAPAAPASSGADQQPPAPTTGSSAESAGQQLAVEGMAQSRKVDAFRIHVLGAHAVRSVAGAPSHRARARTRVLGAHATSATPVAAVTPARQAGGGLPFTGLQLGLLVAVGLAALLGGITLRRATTIARR